MLGGDLSIIKGKRILDAACGAGRFTEIMLKAGGDVLAADLSNGVEANYRNCHKYKKYQVCQADILQLPVRKETFNIVTCIGSLQNTENPEKVIEALYSYLKPGGLLAIDIYAYGYPSTFSRRILRAFLTRCSGQFALKFIENLTALLWPLHRFFRRFKTKPWSKIRGLFLKLSPIVDYQTAYPQLSPKLLYLWAILDTHDTLTDQYKHLRSVTEIKNYLKKLGLKKIKTYYAGNGVESQAYKPK